MAPKVSVLLSLNRIDAFFEPCFLSITAGMAESDELVLIGDTLGETEKTKLEALTKTDSRVRFFNSPGKGLIDALNFGITKCGGEYIARMDADDLFYTLRLTTQVEFLDQHTDCAVVGSQVRYICEHGAELGFSKYPKKVRSFWALKPFSPKVAHPTTLIRKETLNSVGGYRNEFPHAEDYDLWNRILRISKIRNLNMVLLDYRQHNLQISKVNYLDQSRSSRKATYRDIFEIYLKPEFKNSNLDFEELGNNNESRCLKFKGRVRLRWFNSLSSARKLAAEFSQLGGFSGGKPARQKAVQAITRNPLSSMVVFFLNSRALLARKRVQQNVCAECSGLTN